MLPVAVPYHSREMDAIRGELLESLASSSHERRRSRSCRPSPASWAQELGPRVLVAQRPRAGQLRRGARPADRRRAHDLRRARPASGARRLASTSASANGAGTVLPTLRRTEDDRETMLRSLAALYAEGRDIDWRGALRRAEPAHRAAPLPVAARAALARGRAARRRQRLAARRGRAGTRCSAASWPWRARSGNRRSAIAQPRRTSPITACRASRSSRRPATSKPGSPQRGGCRARAAGGAQDRGRARALRAGRRSARGSRSTVEDNRFEIHSAEGRHAGR